MDIAIPPQHNREAVRHGYRQVAGRVTDVCAVGGMTDLAIFGICLTRGGVRLNTDKSGTNNVNLNRGGSYDDNFAYGTRMEGYMEFTSHIPKLSKISASPFGPKPKIRACRLRLTMGGIIGDE